MVRGLLLLLLLLLLLIWLRVGLENVCRSCCLKHPRAKCIPIAAGVVTEGVGCGNECVSTKRDKEPRTLFHGHVLQERARRGPADEGGERSGVKRGAGLATNGNQTGPLVVLCVFKR